MLTEEKTHEKNNIFDRIEIENKNIEENEKNLKLFWLPFNNLSCRFDSFSFLFFTTINPLLTKELSLLRGNNINVFLNLTNKIAESIEKKEKKNFLKIVEENKIYSLDILNNTEGYKKLYHIHHIFNWFFGEILFSIKYKIIKTCSLSFNNVIKKDMYVTYISISVNDIKNEIDIIDKFKTIQSA